MPQDYKVSNNAKLMDQLAPYLIITLGALLEEVTLEMVRLEIVVQEDFYQILKMILYYNNNTNQHN